MTLVPREWEVKGPSLVTTQNFSLDCTLVCVVAHRAATRMSLTGRVRWCWHGEVQIVDQGDHVHRVVQQGKEFGDRHDKDVAWAAGRFLIKLAGGEPEDVALNR